MGDCCNMYVRRPDGELGLSGRATVPQDFPKILLKIFPDYENHPDGETL
jgi:hypothetical protein